ncbi:hypothetical protein [Dongia sp.]
MTAEILLLLNRSGLDDQGEAGENCGQVHCSAQPTWLVAFLQFSVV